MSIVSKPHSVYLPPTSPSHIVCLTCCACPSDVILRGSVGLSPDSLCYNVPPPLCFPFSPPLSLSLWFGIFYFPRQPNEDESSVFTTHTSCPKSLKRVQQALTQTLKNPPEPFCSPGHTDTIHYALSQSLIQRL